MWWAALMMTLHLPHQLRGKVQEPGFSECGDPGVFQLWKRPNSKATNLLEAASRQERDCTEHKRRSAWSRITATHAITHLRLEAGEP